MAAILSRPLCVKQERPFQGLLFIYEGISIAKTGTTDLRLSFLNHGKTCTDQEMFMISNGPQTPVAD